MSLLQFVIIIAAIVFILFGVDLYKRKKMNILHFIVFLWGGAAVILFAFNQELLDSFGRFFGIARGADLLVYWGVILLFYFYIELLNQHTKDKQQLTRLISTQAINECWNHFKDKITSYKNKEEKVWIYSHKFIKELLELNNFKIIKSKNFHILSPLIYRFYKNEKVASKFSIFDSFLSYIPFLKNYSSNIILLCQKV